MDIHRHICLANTVFAFNSPSVALFISVPIEALLFVGLVLGKKWAYILIVVFSVLGVAACLANSLDEGLVVLVGNTVVVVPMVICTRFFFPKAKIQQTLTCAVMTDENRRATETSQADSTPSHFPPPVGPSPKRMHFAYPAVLPATRRTPFGREQWRIRLEQDSASFLNTATNEELTVNPKNGEYGISFKKGYFCLHNITLINRERDMFSFRAKGVVVDTLQQWWYEHS